ASATTAPASAGPTARARLNSIPFRADAAARSSFSTNSGKTARHVGDSNASPEAKAKVSIRRSSGEVRPPVVSAVSTAATATIQISQYRMSFRRSTMSPIAPAGKARTKNGRADAVCVKATYIGPAFSDTINQAAPTFCMNVPTSETTLAIRRLRKVGDRNGRQRLAGTGFAEVPTPLVSLADSPAIAGTC